ncbi:MULTISPECIES: biotin-independent malonate decarboxylase subunit beta [unclassified Mesorhizobium]|uniref:biotin-independent malonate decarboxylase subunit beta n=1 Tax=unclassified Mesorhizobium TaxID=325217 RepID=UPI000FC99864|nr:MULTISPECIES: biotin-independent malonate decarboxylase subunit beta [unclassified Mesorhizobium]RUV12271.1 biotin-independent malonate decarboxylase subunit beta [Mesorhizobium sp. M1A.F.Ca.IN.022.04.1.1]RWG37199.1 MAG: biotin-independent malonate decarboxylase subunit beta [Mesorhizobium sp.]
MSDRQSWYEQSARGRLSHLLDAGSFSEFLGPETREMSPHLSLFDLPRQFDDGIVVGAGAIEGYPVLCAAQEGRFMGGAIGEIHGAKLAGLLRAAGRLQRDVVILFDTGGVRLQEANAGELAISEIIRALLEARAEGCRVVGLVGGRAGCYGGGSLIAGCCSALVISEQGRLSVSGPEVIETNKGVEEFDSRDRALVWRTMGGKHRYLIGGADIFVEDDVAGFRCGAIETLKRFTLLDQSVLAREQARLEKRLQTFGDAVDGTDVWARLGVNLPAEVPELDTDGFLVTADACRESADAAR